MSPVPSQAASWPLWNAYAARFISAEGRVIDPQRDSITTSEGQAYALFFSLVANDRPRFDKLLNWTRDNLAGGDLTARLPAWKWGRSLSGRWGVLDPNPASDADLWIAYTLLEAGRLWQEPRYTHIGKLLANRVAIEEVADLPGFGPMLLPGPTGFRPNPEKSILNPSYPPLPLLIRLSELEPGGPWGKVASTMPHFLEKSSRMGYAMDWVDYSPSAGFTPAPAPGNPGIGTPVGSYESIRVYLWAGMTHRDTPGSKAILSAIPGMATYLSTHILPPEQVGDQGAVVRPDGPVGFSAALIPYLTAVGQQDALGKQKSRIKAELDPATKLYGRQPTYYDQNLAMFGTGWQEHRFEFGVEGELRVEWKRA